MRIRFDECVHIYVCECVCNSIYSERDSELYTNIVILLNHWSENKNDMSFGFNGGVSVCPEVPVRLTISNHFNGQKVVKAQFLPFL